MVEYGIYTPREKNFVVEVFMWFFLFLSWLGFFFIVGSRPGYLKEGDRPPNNACSVGDEIDDTGALLAVDGGRTMPKDSNSDGHLEIFISTAQHTIKASHIGEEKTSESLAQVSASPSRECSICLARQLPRSYHCRQCNRCVATFDHHCGFLYTCIGERNRARFLLFIFLQALAQGTVIGIINTAFVWRMGNVEWVAANVGAIASLVFLWIIQVPLIVLLAIHVWCCLTNYTSMEVFKGIPSLWYMEGKDSKECDIPFSQGFIGNIRIFCCTLEAWDCFKRSGKGEVKGREPCCFKREEEWIPFPWVPKVVDRDSPDMAQLWENAAWSCC